MGQEFGQASAGWFVCSKAVNWDYSLDSTGGYVGLESSRSLPSLIWCLCGDGWKAESSWDYRLHILWPLQHGVVRVAGLMWQFRAPWKSVLRDLSGSYKASSHLVSKSIQCHTSATLCWLQVSQRPAFKERGYTTVWIQACRVHCMQGSSLVAQFHSGCLIF